MKHDKTEADCRNWLKHVCGEFNGLVFYRPSECEQQSNPCMKLNWEGNLFV